MTAPHATQEPERTLPNPHPSDWCGKSAANSLTHKVTQVRKSAVKDLICHATFLHLPDYSSEAGRFVIQTDASKLGLGAVLMQYPPRTPVDQEDSTMPHPVAFASRGLNKAERGYDAGRREGLGIVWALEQFRPYIVGKSFQLQTDHSNLEWLLTSDRPGSPQYGRWKAVLAEHDLTLKYKKGVLLADALSRDPRWEDVRYRIDRADMIGAVAHRCSATTVASLAATAGPLTAVDLFCAAGGSSSGLAAGGIRPVLGIDRDKDALDVFSRLHPTARARCADAHDVGAIVSLIRSLPVPPDVIAASPPCAPWSTAASRAARSSAALRRDAGLLIQTAVIVARVRPRYAVIENVPRARLSPQWQVMREVLQHAGYSLEERVVDAAKFGVPQHRRRVILVASLHGHTGTCAHFDARSSQPDTTVQDAFPNVDTFYAYARNNTDRSVFPSNVPSPTLRTNCGYFPQPGSYAAREKDRGLSIDACRRWLTHA